MYSFLFLGSDVFPHSLLIRVCNTCGRNRTPSFCCVRTCSEYHMLGLSSSFGWYWDSRRSPVPNILSTATQAGKLRVSYCRCQARLSGDKQQRFALIFTGQCNRVFAYYFNLHSVTLSCVEGCKPLPLVAWKSGWASAITCKPISQLASTSTVCWARTRMTLWGWSPQGQGTTRSQKDVKLKGGI